MPKNRGIQLNDNADNGEVMDIKVVPVRDASGKIIQGMVIGDTLQQNKALILIAQPGDIKMRPDMGVGIEDLVLSTDYLEARHRIREHFAKDGLNVTRVDLYNDKPFRIDASYTD